jgi:RNA polymerase sigma factor (sigma-70 family)
VSVWCESEQRPGVSEQRDTFRAIYLAHHATLCAYFARRVARGEVEDLVAETFVVAWRKLPRRIEQPLPWLYAVAGKVLANHRRKVARRDPASFGDALSAAAPADPADLLSGDRGLAHAWAQLSEHEREALRLVAWEGLSPGAAARAANCSRAAFAARLSRARRRLQRALDEPALLVKENPTWTR